MPNLNMAKIIEKVSRHLQRLGIQPDELRNAAAFEMKVADAEHQIGGRIPSEMRALYLEFANGFTFRWSADDDFDDADERGCFELPDLTTLVRYREPYKDFWMASIDLSTLPARMVRNLRKVEETIANMQQWLPFWEEASGDQFCLDLRDGKVVFNEHDWFDGGDGSNGTFVAESFGEFVLAWANVCFSSPVSLYWPDAFSSQGVDWSSNNFDKRYIIL